MAKQRLEVLDSARGIAALMVVFLHAFEISAQEAAKSFTKWFMPGYAGVLLFFIISGFVIGLSLDRSSRLRDYVIARAFRIYPLFLFSLAVMVMLLAFKVADWPFPMPFTKAAIFNLTMLQEWFKVPSLMALYWTLGYEMAFYILMGLLFVFKIHQKAWTGFWLIAGLTNLQMILSLAANRWIGGGKILGFLFLFLGVVFYATQQGRLTKKHLNFAIATVLVTVLIQQMIAPKFLPSAVGEYGSTVATFLVVLTARVGLEYIDRSSKPVLIYLGTISYSVYLMHGIVTRLLSKTPISQSFWTMFPVTVALTILISAITYKLIETPGIELGKKLRQKLS